MKLRNTFSRIDAKTSTLIKIAASTRMSDVSARRVWRDWRSEMFYMNRSRRIVYRRPELSLTGQPSRDIPSLEPQMNLLKLLNRAGSDTSTINDEHLFLRMTIDIVKCERISRWKRPCGQGWQNTFSVGSISSVVAWRYLRRRVRNQPRRINTTFTTLFAMFSFFSFFLFFFFEVAKITFKI